jgi:hypothetical protein
MFPRKAGPYDNRYPEARNWKECIQKSLLQSMPKYDTRIRAFPGRGYGERTVRA